MKLLQAQSARDIIGKDYESYMLGSFGEDTYHVAIKKDVRNFKVESHDGVTFSVIEVGIGEHSNLCKIIYHYVWPNNLKAVIDLL